MSGATPSARERLLGMFALIVAGEMIFSLPFHLPRYFRPSVLETFGLSNAELGDIFAVYGVTAMLAYFPGGTLADRYPARRLMTASLVATALGGLWLASLPGGAVLRLLYGYWGVTTILLFWAAMIRATREWGGALAQGRAFGLLDGGRGLAAAAVATLAVVCVDAVLPTIAWDTPPAEREHAMRVVVLFYCAATLAAALMIWCWLPEHLPRAARGADVVRGHVLAVLRRPLVWLQALVVVCAYCGYKGLDNYALYAYDVLGMSETRAAAFTAAAAWLRPVAAIAAGFAADRLGAARTVLLLFALLAGCYGLLAALDAVPAFVPLIYAGIVVSFAAVFALRGVYFALIAEARVPAQMTGTAVGLVSVVGFTPDIFFAPVAGRLLDAAPGMDGHQHYFLLLAGIAVVGLVVAALLSARVNAGAASMARLDDRPA
ncbi:MAG: MFS transporter [Gammaproteobacteria bacterium]